MFFRLYNVTARLERESGSHIIFSEGCIKEKNITEPVFIIDRSGSMAALTDGMENSGRLYTSKQVKGMIEQCKAERGWEFLFIGANIDAVETSRHIGIASERAVNYVPDAEGTSVVYDAVCCAASCLREDSPLDAGWNRSIARDYSKRGH